MCVHRHAKYKGIVMGGSAGSFEAMAAVLSVLPKNFTLPILVVQHLHPSDNGAFARHLGRTTGRQVVEPCDKEPLESGIVFIAPANYHMLVERNQSIALSIDEKVNWSRPSIDVLFHSAAYVWGDAVIAVIFSGASTDGAQGMRAIREAGGLTIAQDPESAKNPVMPRAAIHSGAALEVLGVREIGQRLIELVSGDM